MISDQNIELARMKRELKEIHDRKEALVEECHHAVQAIEV